MEEFKEELRAVEKYLIYGEYEEGMEKGEKANFRRKCRNNYKLEDGVLHYRKNITCEGKDDALWRVCVRSDEEKERILESCHAGVAGSHLGRDKTIDKISARFFWKNMYEDIKKYVKECDVCQRMNPKFVKSNAKLHPVPVRAQVWHKVGIDLIGPLPETKKGNKYIVTLLDYFSKWPEACPIPNKTALAVAQFLFEMFCRFGCCEVVISDQGREFVNAVQAELFALTGTKHCLTSAYHPQSNGLTERFNQTLQTALQKVVNDEQNNWDDHISAILFAYRTAKQKATKLSPFELMYCRKAILPVEMDPLNEVSSGNEKECEDDEKDAEMGIIMDEEDDENTGCSGIIEDWIDGTTHEACSGLEVDHIIQRAKEMQQLRDKIYERALANIQVAQQKDKALYDKKHASSKVFSVGTQVLLRNSARDTKKGDKLKPRWMGPYCIHTVNDKGVYTLRNARTGKVLKNGVNVCRLTEYHSHSLESSVLPQPISSVAPNCLSSTGENKTVVIDENAPTPEKMQSKVWISTLKLYSSDKDDLENGRELSDAVIDAAQTLLKHCYTNISSFQSPLLGRVLQFEPASHNAVQIHHTEGHWVCSSNIGAKQGEVLLMDSLVSSPSDSLLLQLAHIYQAAPDVQNMSIRVLPVQQQKGSKDCGLFAVAFATELCSGEDPTRAVFKQCSMRQHLYNCLEAGEISRFPQYTKKELRSLPKNTAKHSTLKTFDQELFCLCRLPECYDKRMVQCTACKSWYHFQCVGFKSKNEVPKSWKCNSCISE
ncbi:hypothetical protein EMCRGX_G013057 [Ephydatia muelleri]|eukprot:Em0004g695a